MCRVKPSRSAFYSLALILSAVVSVRASLAEEQPASAPTTPATPMMDASLYDRLKALEQKEAERTANEKAAAQLAAKVNGDFTPQTEGPAPFAYGDFSWAPGNYGAAEKPYSFGPFTGELRVDVAYHYDFSNPIDDTIVGSSEVFRSNEIQLTMFGFGGDFYYKGVQARLMTQFGMYSTTTPRNDSSPSRGQWDLADAYRYLAEAYGGYHWSKWSGVNLQAGIFMSYVGLWSYYNFDNWTYQPSYVSSNTPWFFNGMRIQFFPNDKLKVEPWIVNGWQSYGKFNEAPGLGLQILWKPAEWITILGNQYFGTDELGILTRKRVHTDDSVMVKYYEDPKGMFKAAFSVTLDAGCEWAGGVQCQDFFFLGFMAYQRFWFYHDYFGFTVGGGAINNPGRYLVLLPPINGATASTGTPYFPEGANSGEPFEAWDMQTTFDVMPLKNITFRVEYNHRAASVPYFAGAGGVTPPGGNNGNPSALVPGWAPDLVKTEDRLSLALLVKI